MSPLYACLRCLRLPDAAVAVAKDFSPRLQRYGSDCVVVDVSGLGRLIGEPPMIGEELAARLAECARAAEHPASAGVQRANAAPSQSSVRSKDPRHSVFREIDPPSGWCVAVASTQIAAMLLSSGSPGLTVVADVASALAPLRLDVLRQVVAEMHGAVVVRGAASTAAFSRVRTAAFWETCEQAFAVLQRWGLKTLGEYAALPSRSLSARLGQAGIALQGLARGLDAGPLVPDADVPRFMQRVELEWPIDGLEPLAFVLARLLEPLSSALERADRGAAAIHLDLRLVDRTMHTRTLQLPAAMRDAKVLRTLLVLDLESHPPAAAIDIVTIEVDPAPGRVLQYSLLERARPSAETLATLTARLGALVGESRCGHPVLLDSHGPDAFELRRFAPDERVARTPAVDAYAAVQSDAGRNDTSAALEPKADPIIEGAVLRRFRPPIALRVTIERGRPSYVFIDRRGMPGGHVEQCAGPWRSSGAWWNDPSRQWNRDEWDVALSDGAVCRLFHARESGQWFLDGIVD